MSVWIYRVSHLLWTRRARRAAGVIAALNRVLFGVDIHPAAVLGPGLVLMHNNGIVVHGSVRSGKNCVLYQQVTLGLRGDEGLAPRLGDGVRVYAGAKVLGDVTLGDAASIGANAVVLIDVPAGATAVGVPARITADRAS
jgi:serine O-acetyltransferase